jgi:hypothetical protein
MKRLFKILLIVVVFFVSLICLLPKENLYYFVLENLQKQKVLVNSQSLQSKCFSFGALDSTVQYDGIEAVSIKKINIKLYIVQTKLELYNISIDNSLKNILPSEIKKLEIYHSIINPVEVIIKAKLAGAKAYGVFNIVTNTLVLNIDASNKFKRSYSKIIKNMKKQENGEYQIEYKL